MISKREENRLTHIAFQVTEVDRTVDFYRRYTRLQVVHERPDTKRDSTVVWLRDPDEPGSLTIVLFKADEAMTRDRCPSLNHLGFAVESRAAVDEVARRGREEGILVLAPTDLGEIVGYICEISDPDGNVLEFSHGQSL